MKSFVSLLILCGLICYCDSPAQNNRNNPGDLGRVNLPPGFSIDTYAVNIQGARSMCLTANGTLFVGTRDVGKVYALRDIDGDYRADSVYTLIADLYMPNGVAFRDGALYVAEVNRILKFDNIEARLSNPPEPVVVTDRFPSDGAHGWKFIAFGPDGKLYIPIGMPCNVCEPDDEVFGTITRMNPDGSDFEIYCRGVRNSVGFSWHPLTNELWFTDNGRDNLGDNIPADELNYAPQAGMHFGFPYCLQGDLLDPDYGQGRNCQDFAPPAIKLGSHVASLGMRFYTGEMFPEEYRNQIFIAEHGSWNRSQPIGYRISLVRLNGNDAISYEVFADGWLESSGAWGRPVDLQVMQDGSMLVSDDTGNSIYRIKYGG